jgi:hypothetical protein
MQTNSDACAACEAIEQGAFHRFARWAAVLIAAFHDYGEAPRAAEAIAWQGAQGKTDTFVEIAAENRPLCPLRGTGRSRGISLPKPEKPPAVPVSPRAASRHLCLFLFENPRAHRLLNRSRSLLGKRIRVGNEMVQAVDVFVGSKAEPNSKTGLKVGGRRPVRRAPSAPREADSVCGRQAPGQRGGCRCRSSASSLSANPASPAERLHAAA